MMTDAEMERASELVSKKWTLPRSCICCGGTKFDTGPVKQICKFHDGEMVTPVVPVFCASCGWTLLFSAMISGVIGRDGKLK